MHRRKRHSRIPMLIASVASLVFLGIGSIAMAVGYSPVTIKVDGAERVINTGARSPLAVIRQAGIEINARDRVEDRIRSDNTREIDIIRAYPIVVNKQGIPELKWGYQDRQETVPVIIKADNKVFKTFSTANISLRSLVLNAGISLSPLDRVIVKVNGKQKELYVQRISRRYHNSTEVITAPVKRIADKTLEKGKEKVASAGTDGLRQTIMFTETVNGKIVTSGKKTQKTLVEAQPKVVKVGAKTPANSVSVPSVTAPVGKSQAIAHQLVLSRGWNERDFSCLVKLWNHESGWRTNAANASGAYGIPQALPGSKMGAYGADWRTNPATQIKWGLSYVGSRYGSPCGAWAYFTRHHWY